MNELITAISTGFVAFISTNIDDIAILLLFVLQINIYLRPQHIFLGQYLGFIVLLALSLSGLFGSFVLGYHWIGLLDLIAITIGINSLVNQEEKAEDLIIETAPSSDE